MTWDQRPHRRFWRVAYVQLSYKDETENDTIRGMRTVISIAVLFLITGSIAQNSEPTRPIRPIAPSSAITLYFPQQRAWFNRSLGYQSDKPLLIFDEKQQLVRLEPTTFITLSLPSGAHQLWVKGCGANAALPLNLKPKERVFVRVLYRRVCNSPEKSLEVVNCETASQEAERMIPLKPKNIYVPISQVIDTGAYFQPKCTD